MRGLAIHRKLLLHEARGTSGLLSRLFKVLNSSRKLIPTAIGYDPIARVMRFQGFCPAFVQAGHWVRFLRGV